ncbi:unnamed protein product [Toxocara canis]|uniref:Uncharacterized protein n=1 Tax=Toxocara canis TaxID=6265 RepID=A0A183UMI6_TOXCA|nr:unnamed protein product [Toxocara canis]
MKCTHRSSKKEIWKKSAKEDRFCERGHRAHALTTADHALQQQQQQQQQQHQQQQQCPLTSFIKTLPETMVLRGDSELRNGSIVPQGDI